MRYASTRSPLATAVRRAGLVAVAAGLIVALSSASCSGETLALTLDDAISVALEHGHELGMARAAEDGARARLWQARSAFLPSIGASASYTKLDEAPYMDGSQFGSMFAPLLVPFEYLVDQGYLDPSTLEGLSGGRGRTRSIWGTTTSTRPVSLSRSRYSRVGHCWARGARRVTASRRPNTTPCASSRRRATTSRVRT